jgi:hypothetical protein
MKSTLNRPSRGMDTSAPNGTGAAPGCRMKNFAFDEKKVEFRGTLWGLPSGYVKIAIENGHL